MPTLRPPSDVLRGLKAGLPVAAGYLPVAVAFGLLARQSGLTVGQALGMSAWVYAGASQFAAVNLIGAGVPALQIVLATFLLNLRHLLMSTSLAARLEGLPASASQPGGRRPPAWLLGFGITDETFVVAGLGGLAEGGAAGVPAFGFLGLIVMAWLAWGTGTLAGALLAGLVPLELAASLGVGLYAMFIGLLVPTIRSEWRKGAIALGSALLSWGLSLWVPAVAPGWRIVLATLAASAAGLLLVREEEA